MNKIDWPYILEGKNTDSYIEIILAKTSAILGKIAPMKKLTKREAKVKQVSWLTIGILKSTSGRDALQKKVRKEKDPEKKVTLFSLNKTKHNTIVTLMCSSKKKYFQKYQSNAKNISNITFLKKPFIAQYINFC